MSPGTDCWIRKPRAQGRPHRPRSHPVVTPTKRTWSSGSLPGVFPRPADHLRDPQIGRSTTTVRGRSRSSSLPRSTLSERVSVIRRPFRAGTSTFRSATPILPAVPVGLHRSPSSVAFGTVIVGVLIALAGVGLFVAVQTARGRQFQPPMTAWYAAMLFAVIPLRNALPDAPPIGFLDRRRSYSGE